MRVRVIIKHAKFTKIGCVLSLDTMYYSALNLAIMEVVWNSKAVEVVTF